LLLLNMLGYAKPPFNLTGDCDKRSLIHILHPIN
jgi:hypothetical protein